MTKIDLSKLKRIDTSSFAHPKPKHTNTSIKPKKKGLKKSSKAEDIRRSLQKPKDLEKMRKGVAPGTEAQLQDQCEAYLTIKGIWYFHIPASTYQSRGANVLAGIPDLLIFKKEWMDNKPCIDNSCLLVELKTRTGKRGPKQEKWAKECVVHLIRNFDDFKELIDEWG